MKYFPSTFSAQESAVIRTLAYGDIFDYPLTVPDIKKYLIHSFPMNQESILRVLESLLSKKAIGERDSYYFLVGREKLVQIRRNREEASFKKMKIVSSVCTSLSYIPTIRFVGVTGGLALKNADEQDDIDLFIITEEKRMWLTRFAVLAMLQSIGKRRSRNEKNTRDKICVNMFMDERSISISRDLRDLYTAHEVVQVIPVLNKHKTYEKFISANIWVKQFLPNSMPPKFVQPSDTKKNNRVFDALEYFVKVLQLWYMNKHRTRETISDTYLAFHPVDYRHKILTEYKKRLNRYKMK